MCRVIWINTNEIRSNLLQTKLYFLFSKIISSGLPSWTTEQEMMTFSRNQPSPGLVPSCPTRMLTGFPRSTAAMSNTSTWKWHFETLTVRFLFVNGCWNNKCCHRHAEFPSIELFIVFARWRKTVHWIPINIGQLVINLLNGKVADVKLVATGMQLSNLCLNGKNGCKDDDDVNIVSCGANILNILGANYTERSV